MRLTRHITGSEDPRIARSPEPVYDDPGGTTQSRPAREVDLRLNPYANDHGLSRQPPTVRQGDLLDVAVTDKRFANLIFSFGRDHGYYGRILSQTVVVLPTVAVRRRHEVYGFCFTPQDGNSLLSSMSAALWLIEPDWKSVENRLTPLRRWLYREI